MRRNGSNINTATKQAALMSALDVLMAERKPFLDNHITRRALADMLGTNDKYLQETIKRNTGYRYWEYVNRLRLTHACLILRDRNCDLSVEAIAVESGFGSRSTFYRLFRKHYGVSPAEYRATIAPEAAGPEHSAMFQEGAQT